MNKNIKNNMRIINAGDMSASVSSAAIDVSLQDDIGLEIAWTGTPTGTITINASNNGGTFYSLTFATALTQPSGSASGIVVALANYPFTYLKVTYTRSSGSGSLDCYLTSKDI